MSIEGIVTEFGDDPWVAVVAVLLARLVAVRGSPSNTTTPSSTTADTGEGQRRAMAVGRHGLGGGLRDLCRIKCRRHVVVLSVRGE
jgi:hypothetical protein